MDDLVVALGVPKLVPVRQFQNYLEIFKCSNMLQFLAEPVAMFDKLKCHKNWS